MKNLSVVVVEAGREEGGVTPLGEGRGKDFTAHRNPRGTRLTFSYVANLMSDSRDLAVAGDLFKWVPANRCERGYTDYRARTATRNMMDSGPYIAEN